MSLQVELVDAPEIPDPDRDLSGAELAAYEEMRAGARVRFEALAGLKPNGVYFDLGNMHVVALPRLEEPVTGPRWYIHMLEVTRDSHQVNQPFGPLDGFWFAPEQVPTAGARDALVAFLVPLNFIWEQSGIEAS